MEIDILMAIQELRTPFLDFLLSHITALGDSGFLWILAGVTLLSTRKYKKQGFLLLLSLLCCFFLGNILIKNLVARERPCWMFPEVELLIKNPKDFSFPSAHSMTGFAGATSLWLTNKRFGIAAYIVASAIAFSRLYLFVHWPTDVLFGIIMGIVVALLVFAVGNNRKKEKEGWEYENV